MRNLIYLIIRYSALVVFILLECLSFYLIVNYNRSQKEIWSHSSNLFTGEINKRMENIQNYFSLQVQNDSLLSENARLREQIINYRVASKENAFQEFESTDTLRKYHLIPVGVCGKTLNLRNNYFTLCKGRAAGIRPGMGVISDKGIVGIVKTVSNHFSTVLLLTNSQSRVSARIKDSNYPGTIVWNNSNPRIVNLIEVPRHAVVEIGDSIVSSGYSISFAPDVYIGRIADFKIHEGNSNYSIDVELSEDLSALDFVYVIDYHYIEEKSNQLELENE